MDGGNYGVSWSEVVRVSKNVGILKNNNSKNNYKKNKT